MHASGKPAQHARSVRGIGGLAEKLAIHNHHGIGAEHAILRTLTRNRQRFLARQALGAFFCAFSWQRVLRDVRRLHLERDPGVTQKSLTTRRWESKHEQESIVRVSAGRRWVSVIVPA